MGRGTISESFSVRSVDTIFRDDTLPDYSLTAHP